MIRTEDILSTLQMIREEQLDVRTVTLGINLQECASYDEEHMCEKIRAKIAQKAGRLVAACEAVSQKYGIPVVNKRIAVSPVTWILEGRREEAFLRVARQLDACAAEVGVDFLGGF